MVQGPLKFLVTSHEFNHVGHVLRNEEIVLPGIALGVGVHALGTVGVWVERLHPLAVLVLGAEEPRLGIIEIVVEVRATVEVLVVSLLAEVLGQAGHAGIVIGVLERDGYRLALTRLRQIAILLEHRPGRL